MVQFAEKVVNELFTVKTSKAVDAGALNLSSTKEKYEFIGRSIGNNSIQGYLSDKAKPYFDPNEANTISISQIGQQIATYHENEYYASQNMFVLKPIDFKLNRITGLYFTTIFNCQLKQYLGSYTSYPTQNDVKQWKIKVPVTAAGALDTDYMASYVRKIEASYVRKIEAYLSVLGYKSMDDVKLTDHEQKLLDGGVKAQPTSKFKVGKLFEIDTGSLLPADGLHKGNIPRISVQTINNGIIGYYDTQNMSNARHFSNFISVNFMGNAFYHKGKASVEMKVHVLHLANGMPLNVKLAMFLIATLNKIFGNGRFGYGNQLSSSKLKHNDFYIELPVTPSGDPDWQFMEDYITAIEKLKVLKLKQFLDHKLDFYQKVINQN